MPQYDASRQMDLNRMQSKINDPNTPERERKLAADAIYAIKSQAKSPAIQRLRDRMTVAIRNGDTALAEKIGEEAKKIDKDWKR